MVVSVCSFAMAKNAANDGVLLCSVGFDTGAGVGAGVDVATGGAAGAGVRAGVAVEADADFASGAGVSGGDGFAAATEGSESIDESDLKKASSSLLGGVKRCGPSCISLTK